MRPIPTSVFLFVASCALVALSLIMLTTLVRVKQLTKPKTIPGCEGAIKPIYQYPPRMVNGCGELLDPHLEKRGKQNR